MRLRLTGFAKAELFRVHRYYERRQQGLGDAFLDEVQTVFNLIKTYLHAWPKFGRTARRCRLTRFKYGILYRIEGDEIVVFVVAHLARKPSHWRKLIG